MFVSLAGSVSRRPNAQMPYPPQLAFEARRSRLQITPGELRALNLVDSSPDYAHSPLDSAHATIHSRVRRYCREVRARTSCRSPSSVGL